MFMCLDVCFLGYNVPHKKAKRGVIGPKHKVTKDESMKWFQQKVSYFRQCESDKLIGFWEIWM